MSIGRIAMKLSLVVSLVGALTLLPSFHAKADAVSPFGATTGTGPWTLTSTASTYSGLEIDPAPLTFSQLSSLSVTFTDLAGGAYGGSPRFSVGLQDGADVHFIHISLGTSPNFADNDPAAFTTAFSGFNVIGNNDTGRYDTSQFVGGSPFTDYSSALALLGSLKVTELDFVVDGGWGANGVQQLTVNEFNFGSTSETPLPAALPLFATGLGALGLIARRWKKKAAAVAA
jgi:hypothetical protein